MNKPVPIKRRASLTSQPTSQQQQFEPDAETEEYDDIWPARMPTSARRYQASPPPVITQGNKRYVLHQGLPPQPATPQEPKRKKPQNQHRRVHWLFIFGIGMLAMLMVWVLGSSLLSWWGFTQDTWHYGYPRTYQCDAVVGHHDSQQFPSHFIAINLHTHIEIIEFPGGDPTKARVYLGPTLIGQDADLTPVTLSFKDVNGDGKPDMIVFVGDGHFVFINDSGQFRPIKPGELVNL